ncbi:GTPase-activating protein RRC [Acrasis kona]|uniref:GTPase-activating protein RRC n=1 Tax=Acrasis kona TaxID=1008807 RepID=A0AAW2ZAA4_9EUKA
MSSPSKLNTATWESKTSSPRGSVPFQRRIDSHSFDGSSNSYSAPVSPLSRVTKQSSSEQVFEPIKHEIATSSFEIDASTPIEDLSFLAPVEFTETKLEEVQQNIQQQVNQLEIDVEQEQKDEPQPQPEVLVTTVKKVLPPVPPPAANKPSPVALPLGNDDAKEKSRRVSMRPPFQSPNFIPQQKPGVIGKTLIDTSTPRHTRVRSESHYGSKPMSPSIRLGVFGESLENRVQRDQVKVPLVVLAITAALETKMFEDPPVGLFRESGDMTNVNNMKQAINEGVSVDITNQEPNDLASLLKMYFRELPAPLFPFEYYDDLIQLGKYQIEKIDTTLQNLSEEEKHNQWKVAVSELVVPRIIDLFESFPLTHSHVAFTLFSFLTRLSNIKECKMNVANLSTCWAPNLFQSPKELSFQDTFLNTACSKSIFATLVEFHAHLFKPVFLSDQDKRSVRNFGRTTVTSFDLIKRTHSETQFTDPDKCVTIIKRGGQMVKYNNRLAADRNSQIKVKHFRTFQLSEDGNYLVWLSTAKKQKLFWSKEPTYKHLRRELPKAKRTRKHVRTLVSALL